jgi:hypothetical protein
LGNQFQGIGNGRNDKNGDFYAFIVGGIFLHHQKEGIRVGINQLKIKNYELKI